MKDKQKRMDLKQKSGGKIWFHFVLYAENDFFVCVLDLDDPAQFNRLQHYTIIPDRQIVLHNFFFSILVDYSRCITLLRLYNAAAWQATGQRKSVRKQLRKNGLKKKWECIMIQCLFNQCLKMCVWISMCMFVCFLLPFKKQFLEFVMYFLFFRFAGPMFRHPSWRVTYIP